MAVKPTHEGVLLKRRWQGNRNGARLSHPWRLTQGRKEAKAQEFEGLCSWVSPFSERKPPPCTLAFAVLTLRLGTLAPLR
jgi:hypothetical protein